MTKIGRVVFIILFFLLSGGCAKDHLSQNFGKSYDAVFTAQIKNPSAPQNPLKEDLCPGVISNKIYEKYKESYGSMGFDEQLGKMIRKSMEKKE